MLPACITTILWSYCVIAARRSIEQLGENLANVVRILVALLALGLMAHFFGKGLSGGGFHNFFLSGVIGFGLGDIGIFYALPRLGSRLVLLISQCGAAPIAGLIEWFWLGTAVSALQLLAISIILFGIIMAIAPKHIPADSLPRFMAGITFGILAALGQGLGAVLSRQAYADARAAGSWTGEMSVLESIWMGATTGYQRLIGGTLVIVLFYLASLCIRQWRTHPHGTRGGDPLSNKAKYVFLNAASGPIFGIIFFQWALATTPSIIVQPIVAMTPLVVMPMAWFFEGDRPSRRAIVGSLISVIGVVLLATTRM